MFTIYSRTVCPGCTTAKAFLTLHNKNYEVRNIETDPVAREEFKRTFPNAKSVPKILWTNGYDDFHLIDTLEDLETFVKEMPTGYYH